MYYIINCFFHLTPWGGKKKKKGWTKLGCTVLSEVTAWTTMQFHLSGNFSPFKPHATFRCIHWTVVFIPTPPFLPFFTQPRASFIWGLDTSTPTFNSISQEQLSARNLHHTGFQGIFYWLTISHFTYVLLNQQPSFYICVCVYVHM